MYVVAACRRAKSRVRDGVAGLMALCGRGVWEVLMEAEREETSAGVLPRRVILRDVRVERRSGLFVKGGLSRPGLGEMRNFWYSGGMERLVLMLVERSKSVAVEGKVRWWGWPRWWIVRSMVCVRSSGVSSA